MLAGPPYRYGGAEIGLFTLVGAAGALVARIAGRAADRGWQRPLTGVLLVLGVGSFGALAIGAQSLGGSSPDSWRWTWRCTAHICLT